MPSIAVREEKLELLPIANHDPCVHIRSAVSRLMPVEQELSGLEWSVAVATSRKPSGIALVDAHGDIRVPR
jgi:hypothetical protein